MSSLQILSERDGYSLTELIVAFTVLTFASIGLFYLTTTTTTGTLRSQEQAAALELAIDKIEALKNTAFDSLSSGSDSGQITAGGSSGGIYSRSWTVSTRTVAGLTAKDISVSVSWSGRTVSLATSVVKPNVLQSTVMESFPTVSLLAWDHSQ